MLCLSAGTAVTVHSCSRWSPVAKGCTGLEVHRDNIAVCVQSVLPPMHQAVRGFGSTTALLLKLADCLREVYAPTSMDALVVDGRGLAQGDHLADSEAKEVKHAQS